MPTIDYDHLYKLALEIATEAHAGIFREDGEPYINHPKRVAAQFAWGYGDRRIVALLHDVVEDNPEWTLDRLRGLGFPAHIVQSIDAVTRRQGETYLDFVLRASKLEISSAVKREDIRDNLRTCKPGSRKDKYEMALWILEHVNQGDCETPK